MIYFYGIFISEETLMQITAITFISIQRFFIRYITIRILPSFSSFSSESSIQILHFILVVLIDN